MTEQTVRRAQPAPLQTVDTVEALDALHTGTVIRSERGCVWLVDDKETDGTEMRYMGAGVNDYRTGRVLLKLHGPFAVIWLEV